jgi:hypothetical protein
VSGWNFTASGLLLLAALLNVSTPALVAGCTAGGLLSWLGSSWTQALGMLLLDQLPLGNAVAGLGDGPVVAMLGWDNYRLIGGMALALVLSVPAMRAAYVFTPRELDGEPIDRRLLRRGFWLAGPAALALGVAIPWLCVERAVSRHLLRELSSITGHALSADEVHISLWTGLVEIDGLHVQLDAERQQHRDVHIAKAIAHAQPGPLVRGRFLAEQVLLENVAPPGEAPAIEQIDKPSDEPHVVAMPEGTATASAGEPTIELHRHVSSWNTLSDRLQWLRQVIATCQRVVEADSARHPRRYSAGAGNCQRSTLGKSDERLIVQSMEVGWFDAAWGFGPKAKLVVSHLGGSATSVDRMTCCRMIVPAHSAEIIAELDATQTDRRCHVRFTAYDLPLPNFVPASNSKVLAQHGLLSISGDGWVTDQQVSMDVQFEARDVNVCVLGGEKIGGLMPELWTCGMACVDTVRADGKLTGPWTSPRLLVPMGEFVTHFRHQLRSAGQHDLVAMIDAERQRAASTEQQLVASPPAPVEAPVVAATVPPTSDPTPRVPTIERLPPVVEGPRYDQTLPSATVARSPMQPTATVSSTAHTHTPASSAVAPAVPAIAHDPQVVSASASQPYGEKPELTTSAVVQEPAGFSGNTIVPGLLPNVHQGLFAPPPVRSPQQASAQYIPPPAASPPHPVETAKPQVQRPPVAEQTAEPTKKPSFWSRLTAGFTMNPDMSKVGAPPPKVAADAKASSAREGFRWPWSAKPPETIDPFAKP